MSMAQRQRIAQAWKQRCVFAGLATFISKAELSFHGVIIVHSEKLLNMLSYLLTNFLVFWQLNPLKSNPGE